MGGVRWQRTGQPNCTLAVAPVNRRGDLGCIPGAVQDLWCKMVAVGVSWSGCWKPEPALGLNCKVAAVLNQLASAPLTPSEDREARIAAVLEQLRPAAEQALRQMAEDLVDAPDRELFQGVELRLRDRAHELAAAAHRAGLEGRKKGGTAAPASPAPTASSRPASSTT